MKETRRGFHIIPLWLEMQLLAAVCGFIRVSEQISLIVKEVSL